MAKIVSSLVATLLVLSTTLQVLQADDSWLQEAITTTSGQPYEFATTRHGYYAKNLTAKLIRDTVNFGKGNSDLDDTQWTPVVIWHGMGDTAIGSPRIIRLALERMFGGIQVFSIQIGANPVEDQLAGYFVNVNYQIELVCKEILANDHIRQSGRFNMIGLSQGAQFLRGLIERCPFEKHNIKPANYISLGGQHQGVFGLPNCYQTGSMVCDYIRYMVTTAVYDKTVQEHVVQAEYWHDPTREDLYKKNNIFLADINNENTINEDYKKRLSELDSMVLVGFEQDEMVLPRESSLFGFYNGSNTNQILPMEQTDLYLQDKIGLVSLSQLTMIRVPGRHLEFKMKWFLDTIAARYLAN